MGRFSNDRDGFPWFRGADATVLVGIMITANDIAWLHYGLEATAEAMDEGRINTARMTVGLLIARAESLVKQLEQREKDNARLSA